MTATCGCHDVFSRVYKARGGGLASPADLSNLLIKPSRPLAQSTSPCLSMSWSPPDSSRLPLFPDPTGMRRENAGRLGLPQGIIRPYDPTGESDLLCLISLLIAYSWYHAAVQFNHSTVQSLLMRRGSPWYPRGPRQRAGTSSNHYVVSACVLTFKSKLLGPRSRLN